MYFEYILGIWYSIAIYILLILNNFLFLMLWFIITNWDEKTVKLFFYRQVHFGLYKAVKWFLVYHFDYIKKRIIKPYLNLYSSLLYIFIELCEFILIKLKYFKVISWKIKFLKRYLYIYLNNNNIRQVSFFFKDKLFNSLLNEKLSVFILNILVNINKLFKHKFIFFKFGTKKNSYFNLFFLKKKNYTDWYWKIRK